MKKIVFLSFYTYKGLSDDARPLVAYAALRHRYGAARLLRTTISRGPSRDPR
jgi:hypothetical protein